MAPDAEGGDDPLIGRTLGGKFVLEAKLGAGGMGAVYRARQIALEKTVAIKVLHPGMASDETFVERFRREARAASRLDHPNSLRVFDFGGESDGLLYLAMEYLEGTDLLSFVARHGGLSPGTIVDLISQVLAALSVAHEMNVLHRDLKPDNIMVVRSRGDDGQLVDVVKVCDFGIAKIVEPSPVASSPSEGPRKKHTTAGIIIGTPEYMSPEQARAQPLDGRSDLYSVGVVLYELLTGSVPFDAATPLDIVLKHISEPPPRPSTRAANVDHRLEAICLKALEKDPADRFQSAREMRQALREVSPTSAATLVSVPRVPAALESSETLPRMSAVEQKVTLGGGIEQPSRPDAAARSRRSRTVWIALAGLVPAVGVVVFALHGRGPAPSHDAPPVAAGPTAATDKALTFAPSTAGGDRASSPTPSPAPFASAPKVQATSRAAPHATSASASASPPPAIPAVVTPTPQDLPAPAASQPASTTALAAASPIPTTTTLAVPSAGPTSAPPEAAPAASPAAEAPAYDLARAHVEVSAVTTVAGATSSSVARTISEASSQFTSCYRSELPALKAPLDGSGRLHIETDGAGVVTDARLTGPVDGAIARCVAAAVRGRRIPNVDTGNASADITLKFRAR
jgi:serine/threonine-protein kinase